MLKIYHFAKVNRTKELAISFLTSYFNGTDKKRKPESADEYIVVYNGYLYDDLPDSFWNAYLNGFNSLDNKTLALQNKWNWSSYRLNEIPKHVSSRIKNRLGIYK